MTKRKDVFKFLLSYLKEVKLLLIASFITTIIYSFCMAYIPEIPAKVIDQDIKNIPNLKEFLFNNSMLLLGIVIIFSLAIYARYLLFNALANKVATKMQMNLAAHLLNLKMTSFDEILAGDITSRFCRDINTTRFVYELGLPAIMDSIVLIAVLYVRLAFLNIYICAIGLIYFPILYLLGKLFLRLSVPHIKQYMKHIGELSGFLNESIKSMESIQSFGKEVATSKQFDIHSEGVYKEYRANLFISGFFSWNIVVRIRHLIDILLLIVFGALYLNGVKAPIGVLFIAVAYNGRVFKHFLKIFMELSRIQNAFVAGSRVCQLIELEHERSDGKNIKIEDGKVEFRNVVFEYKKDVPVLHNISFVVNKGETVAFIGKTGCGKSTLMNLLLGFYEAKNGDILIDDNNIKQMSLNSLRNAIAIVLQEPYLFEGSIFENISMGRENITKEEVIGYLEAVGGKNIIARDEAGVMQTVSENGKNFSHGERQIICFARALSFNPKILILDEATSNIDIETERLISHGIEVLKQGRTTLIIAHRIETIKNVDMVYHIREGNIIEKGKFEEIMEYEMN